MIPDDDDPAISDANAPMVPGSDDPRELGC